MWCWKWPHFWPMYPNGPSHQNPCKTEQTLYITNWLSFVYLVCFKRLSLMCSVLSHAFPFLSYHHCLHLCPQYTPVVCYLQSFFLGPPHSNLLPHCLSPPVRDPCVIFNHLKPAMNANAKHQCLTHTSPSPHQGIWANVNLPQMWFSEHAKFQPPQMTSKHT